MFIKFESKKTAPFSMQSQIAEQLLAMAGLPAGKEGSISGPAIAEAIAKLERALAELPELSADWRDEDDDENPIGLGVRAAPLRAMLLHARQIDSYVMWRPE